MRHMLAGGLEAGAPTSYSQSHPINQTQSHAQLYPQTQPYFDPTRNPLLGLLSGVPSTSSSNAANAIPEQQQAALLSALQGILASNPHLLQLAATNVGLSANNRGQAVKSEPTRGGSHADDEHNDPDSDIVILDSSAVDTTAFRKASRRHFAASDTDTSPRMTNSPMPSSRGTHSSPLPASTPPSGQDGTPASSQTSTSTVSPQAETQTSKYLTSGQTQKGNIDPSHALAMPSTPTPSRTRKRKLDEYIQDETHSSTPISPPFPSPSMARTSSSRKVLAAKRAASSPTGGTKSWSSPSARLPSMLGSMRGMAASGSHLQSSSLSTSRHEHPVTSLSNKNGNQSSTMVSGPSNMDHPRDRDAPPNLASDTTSLKRMRSLNLTEFMEECEARKNAKVRKQQSSGRKLGACLGSIFSLSLAHSCS